MDKKTILKENSKNSISERKKKRKSFKEPLVQYKRTHTIAIEILTIDSKVHDKYMKGIAHQIFICNGYNSNVTYPVNFIVSNYSMVEKYLCSNSEKWNINYEKNSIFESNRKLVFLTSDSENVLTDFKEDYVYIIGGIIDRNKHKNFTLNYSNEKNITHCRLPIKEHFTLKGSSVLTCNQVFKILLDFLLTKDLKTALHRNIPKRKILEVKKDNI